MPACDLSVVVPIFNEEQGVGRTVENLKGHLRQLSLSTEIICVNDGSTDRTAEILRATAGIVLVDQARNGGYGAALKAGFARAQGRYIGFVDADETYPAERLAPMVAELDADPAIGLIAGSRLLGAAIGLSRTRMFGNRFFSALSRVLCDTKATDACSGMLVFREEIRELLDLDEFTNDLDFSLQMRCRCARRKISMREIPIQYHERAGTSKLNVTRHGCIFLARIVRERWMAGNAQWTRPPARIYSPSS